MTNSENKALVLFDLIVLIIYSFVSLFAG